MRSQASWRAPGRANLIGEHTDYNGGLVLPIAIDRATTVIATLRTDGLIEARSDRSTGNGWEIYVEAAARTLGEAGVAVGGYSVDVTSDLPSGAGLSSSAALLVATIAAMADLAGQEPDPDALAILAWRAENEYVGVPTGTMDQTVVARARAGHALFFDTRSGERRFVPFEPDADGLALVVIDTGTARRLADGRYAARRAECERAAAALGVAALRDVEFDAIEDDVLRRRARHVVTENDRVLEAVDALSRGDWEAIGAVLSASHASLRDDFEVSSEELDAAVEAAMASGALGARMTGAGFGGCAIALVPRARLDGLRAALPQAFEVRASEGARRVR